MPKSQKIDKWPSFTCILDKWIYDSSIFSENNSYHFPKTVLSVRLAIILRYLRGQCLNVIL